MSQFLRRSIRPTLIILGVLSVWWALDHLIAQPIPNVNVSSQAQYAPILGKRFRTQHNLTAVGYTLDRNYKKQIDYIALVAPPGFSGPEVVAKAELPKGAVLEVVAVLKADSWFVDRIQYLVKRVDASPPLNGPMVLKVDDQSHRNFGLDESTFAPVNGNA